MNLNEYQNLLEQLQDLKESYREIHLKIYYSGFPSTKLSDMPRGGKNDQQEILCDMIDAELIIYAEINVLQARIQSERRKLEKYINGIKNPDRRLIMRLKHINGLTADQIIKETGKSYWSVVKYLKRG